NSIVLQDVVKAKINLSTNRINGFVQHTLPLSKKQDLRLVIGVRATYWDYTKEFNASPRATVSYQPKWEKDWVFRASVGSYYQPPFYRELRNFDGTLSTNPASQHSMHYVLAADHQFLAFGGRKFRLISEVYHKQMTNVIPYEIDNVRIRYYANEKADAYTSGLDLKVNGEFVKDLESWFSVSILQSRENLKNDFYFIQDQNGVDSAKVFPGYIPRPTDQRINFSIFFQDKLSKDPSIKVHLNVVFGSRLPFGPPDFNRYKDTLRMPPYWRADIGFSKEWLGVKMGGKSKIGLFKSIILYAEVFNLFKRSNTISYLWIRDVRAQQYAVPNFLTSRQINLRLMGRF
ncbi:MAG: TonB-dependent receptor, partial [bacterium]